MNSLTAKEVSILDNVTKLFKLGSKLQEVISHARLHSVSNTAPVNAVNASQLFSISGVVKHGETVTINNPAISGSDVYEFLADAAQRKTLATNIAVNISASTTKANGTLTIPTQPTSGDKMTIGTKVYTFVPVGTNTADGEVPIGTDLATAQAAIKAAINGTDTVNVAHPLVTASDFVANVTTITSLIGGTNGNAIATTETFTAEGNVFSGLTLGSGADCTAANAKTALDAAITASDTQGVGVGAGTQTEVALVADVAGAAGNAITLAKTVVNGAFADNGTTLSGGINGTIGYAHEIRTIGQYLYVCLAENLVNGKNWRRVSIGASAY